VRFRIGLVAGTGKSKAMSFFHRTERPVMQKRPRWWLLGTALVPVLAIAVVLTVPTTRDAVFSFFRGGPDRDGPPRNGEHTHQGKTLHEWAQQLQSTSIEDRAAACYAFQYFGSDEAAIVVPSLIPLLKDRDHRLRSGAAYALGRIGPPARDAVLPLTELLADEHAHVRTVAAEALDLMSGPQARAAVPALKAALQNALKDEANDEPARMFRYHIARALGKLGPEARSAVTPLAKLLKDRDADVRSAAGEALGLIGPGARAAVPALTRALEDGEAAVRLEAAQALWRIEKSPRTVPVLVEIFKDDKKPHLRTQAAAALGRVGAAAKAAVPLLVEAAKNDPTRGVKGRYDVRIAAAAALKQIDPGAAARAGLK